MGQDQQEADAKGLGSSQGISPLPRPRHGSTPKTDATGIGLNESAQLFA
jgi:hypothetical protein